MGEEKQVSFETALNKLEEVVTKLEEENVPLEKAIKYYEEGMKLSKLCDDMLQDAQEKITKAMKETEEE